MKTLTLFEAFVGTGEEIADMQFLNLRSEDRQFARRIRQIEKLEAAIRERLEEE